jgi:hypothetical protein
MPSEGIFIALNMNATVLRQQNYSSKWLERMYDINFSFNNVDHDQHECDSVTEGDWVIFRCPICKDYERRINADTCEMRVKNKSFAVRIRDDIFTAGPKTTRRY